MKTYNHSLDDDIMFIHKDVLKRGSKAFKEFNELYALKDSCKEYIQKPTDEYHNCLVEKLNCCYEQVKQKYEYSDSQTNIIHTTK